MAPTRIVIIDGSNFIFRAFFALQQGRGGGRNIQLNTSFGLPTGGLLVFSNMLIRIYLDDKPELMAVVFDASQRSFRHDIDPQYKANRHEAPDDLKPQFPWFDRIVAAFKLPTLRIGGVEADDVIATMTRQARALGMDVDIYTGDKDLMSLCDGHVRVVDTMNDKIYDPAMVEEKFGVPPALVNAWLALNGDSSDNIPGVEGIGKVTATKLLKEHGSIEAILAATDAGLIKGKMGDRLRDPVQRANLLRSQQLVAMKDDVELPADILTYKRPDWDALALAEVFRELEFNKLVARLETIFVSDRERYRTILELPQLDAILADVRRAGELSIYPLFSSPDVRGQLIGVALSAPGVAPAYVPIAHRYLGAPTQLSESDVLSRLAPLLADATLAKNVHDLKSALVVLGQRGIARIENVHCDVQLASYLLDATQASHALNVLAKEHLSHDPIKLESLTGKGKEWKPVAELDIAAVSQHAAEAADIVAALGKLLRPRLDTARLLSLHDDLEVPLSRVLADMERTGIRVEAHVLRALGQKIGEDCQRLEKTIHDHAGFPVNVGSPKQLSELLFDKLGLRSDVMRRTALGYSTDAEQLEELVDLHPIVKPILEHRELSKLKGTYLDALPPLVDAKTGRLHTSYLQAVASTGRLSSKNPNIQNIPVRTPLGREIRRAFVADPGWVLVSADYSQIELRVIAHLSGDAVLTHAFESGIDVHTQTAAEVFDIPLDKVGADERRVAKAVNYGLGYGQSDFGLSRVLDIPRERARLYIERYFERFAGVRTLMEQQIAEAHKQLSVSTVLGRRINIPALASKRFGDRSAAERLARNAPIQGSAADILKLAMLACARLCDESGGQARMLLTVHDELVFEVSEGQAERFSAAVRQAMETAYQLKVPLQVDVGIARSWADAH